MLSFPHMHTYILPNIYIFQGTHIRCHWTVTLIPFPMTLIFFQLRWQEVSVVCTNQTKTLLSLSHCLISVRQSRFFSPFSWIFSLDAQKSALFSQAVTEVKKLSLLFIFSLSRWLFSIITLQLRASLSCGLAVRSPLPGPIQPTPANSYRSEELKLWHFQLK